MSKLVLPIAALAFASWCVYIGGLASLQSMCVGDTSMFAPLFGTVHNCSTVFRWWWFIMSFEFVVVVAAIIAAVTTKLHTSRMSLLGLFAVLMLLFIQASQDSLDYLYALPDGYIEYPLHRIRTLVAGAIMTATANGFMIIVLGMNDHSEDGHVPTTSVEKASAV